MKTKNITMRLEPKFLQQAKELAEFRGRKLTNLVEYLLSTEMAAAKLEGFAPTAFDQSNAEVVGKGGDAALKAEFEKLTGKG